MSEEQKAPTPTPEPPKRPLTQAERERLRHQRDMEFMRRKQMIREAESQEEREKVYNSIHYNHVELKPETTAKKLENFWYHHHFTIIFVSLIVFLLGWFFFDIITNTRYDLDLGLLSYQSYDQDYQAIAKNWEVYLDDQNGDGEVNIRVMNVEFDPNLSKDEQVADQTENQPDVVALTGLAYYQQEAEVTHLAVIFDKSSEYFALIVDDGYYDYLTAQGVRFVDLSALADNPAIDGDRYALQDDPDFADYEGAANSYLVLRDPATINGFDKAGDKRIHKYEVSKQFVLDVINKTNHTSEDVSE